MDFGSIDHPVHGVTKELAGNLAVGVAAPALAAVAAPAAAAVQAGVAAVAAVAIAAAPVVACAVLIGGLFGAVAALLDD